jgi:hypothetical protein
MDSGASTTAVPLAAQMVDVSLRAGWAMGTPAANPTFDFRNAQVTTP